MGNSKASGPRAGLLGLSVLIEHFASPRQPFRPGDERAAL
jgi:hypothetical protein